MQVEIVGYDPRFQNAYRELNLEWIRRHFEVEPMDVAQLEDPYGLILKPGGEIFFVVEDGVAVGTCAMVPHGPKAYELAKMAVAPSARGKGYGDLLMKAALDWARIQGAEQVLLLSNTVLAPAIALYTKHGFQTVHLGPHPDYRRCNIEMSLTIR